MVAIIGILAAIAIPSYQNYTKKAHFTEVIQATAPLKVAIDQCVQSQGLSSGAVTGCAVGNNGVPATLPQATGHIASIGLDAGGNGTITVTADSTMNGDSYILAPSVDSNGAVQWKSSGTCKNDSLC